MAIRNCSLWFSDCVRPRGGLGTVRNELLLEIGTSGRGVVGAGATGMRRNTRRGLGRKVGIDQAPRITNTLRAVVSTYRRAAFAILPFPKLPLLILPMRLFSSVAPPVPNPTVSCCRLPLLDLLGDKRT